ncbi:hypothetical protein [Pseudomonas sp. BN411]|uniref:hypothetical protein n=1 Tax=Pseudomonas sp. BN411 TaxID=2567887 RepID=UPI0024538723|nr:hypothetical protein [Pseudomonas sp. BN411]MDH4560659.1 hypothetical protein [Pseudomonas sp. BN411]
MNKQQLLKTATEALDELLHLPGGVLYSSHETLQPGEVYYLGFNPGGEGGNPLRDDLTRMLAQTENAFLDGEWAPAGIDREPGDAPMQRRTVALLESLGFAVRDICASNLIFVQSKDYKGVEYSLADKCWPVHRTILDIVKPKLILCCGNSGVSAYGYLKRRFGGEESAAASGHGNWSLKAFRAQIEGRECCVVGLPHMSRYEPRNKPQVIEWIRQVAKL